MPRYETSGLPLVALLLALVPLGLVAQTACEVVEPGEMSHTRFTPTGPLNTSVAGVLTGRHAQIACEGCHVGETAPFGKVPDDCLGCHEGDRKNETHYADPNAFPSCSGGSCHRVVDYCWKYYVEECRNGLPTTDSPTDTDTDTGTTETDTVTETGTTDTDTGTYVKTGGTCSQAGCHDANYPVRVDDAPASTSHNAHLDAPYDLFAPASPLACTTCHPDVDYTDTKTHPNKSLEITLEGILIGDNTAATYDPIGKTCSGTYCHGAAMADAAPDPTWDAGGGEVSCGTTCHGSPPLQMYEGGAKPIEHPGLANCSQCHVGADQTGTNVPELQYHLNGVFDLN